MPKKKNEDKNEIKINLKESGIAEFTKRPVPDEVQVEEFEEYLEEVADNEDDKGAGTKDPASQPEIEDEELDEEFDSEINGVTDEEIEESLEEIYQDDKGNMVDVRRMQVLRKHGVVFWFFTFIFLFSFFGALSYGVYHYYLNSGTDATQVDFYIETESEVKVGEEFLYEIKYKNNTNINLRVPRIELLLPENFVVLDSSPASKNGENRIWDIDTIEQGSEGSIKIKGTLIGEEGETSVAFANFLYTPDNFSSEFKSEATASTLIKDTGLDINLNYIKTALVGEVNELDVNFNAQEGGFVNSFRLSLEQLEHISISFKAEEGEEGNEDGMRVTESRPGVYLIENIGDKEERLPLEIVFNEKDKDSEKIKISFEKSDPSGEYKIFWQDELEFEVLKSDLNLALIVNGSREDQGVNFGDKLNYTIAYNNKGETPLNDVVIMVVVESAFLDWATLDTPVAGREKGNAITWTKEEIPELAILERHEEGTIDFSLDILQVSEVEPGMQYEINSYSQYSVGELESGEVLAENEDNRSNEIVNKINSDLRLVEQVLYFNEDNITVGNGPLPLRVGEKTSFKVYWAITNNLHELTEVKVEASLPDYVSWDEKNRTNVGEVRYNQEGHKVIWDVGRLPLSVFRADAEFNISVVPDNDDENTIMVLKPGSRISALDSETGDLIEKITDAKTSKLEDDEISGKTNDGVVRPSNDNNL